MIASQHDHRRLEIRGGVFSRWIIGEHTEITLLKQKHFGRQQLLTLTRGLSSVIFMMKLGLDRTAVP